MQKWSNYCDIAKMKLCFVVIELWTMNYEPALIPKSVLQNNSILTEFQLMWFLLYIASLSFHFKNYFFFINFLILSGCSHHYFPLFYSLINL